MKKSLLFIIPAMLGLSLLFFSCKENKEECSEEDENCSVVNIDSLLDITNKAWENNDTAAIRNTFAENAVILTSQGKVEGKDSIMAKVVKFDPTLTHKLECTPAYKCVCCCCASYTGEYIMTITGKGQTTTEKGTFTFIWKPQKDDSWKLVLMHMAVTK